MDLARIVRLQCCWQGDSPYMYTLTRNKGAALSLGKLQAQGLESMLQSKELSLTRLEQL